MKPNFALSLSFEGIRLLHRATDGWRLAGEVGLDSTDLAGDLAALRAKADRLATGSLSTKLIIPNDQIKYITLDTGDQDLAERKRQAVDALAGATPYEVDDLAYAVSAEGDKTHVAAVARETLAEAEAFAQEHRFAPISWVAIPEDGTFAGEPFFGETKGAVDLLDGSSITPDDAKIVVVGDVIPDTPSASVAAPAEETPKDDVAPQTTDEAAVVDDVETATEKAETAPEDIEPEQVVAEEKPDPVAPPVVKAPDVEPQEAPTASTTTVEAVEAFEETTEKPEDKPIVAGFASRRAPEGKTPSLGGAKRDVSNADVAAASIPPLEDEPQAERIVVPEAPEPRIAAGFLSRRKSPKKDAIPAPAAVTTKPSTEAQRLTIFGARKPEKKKAAAVGGKPRFLGLILTSILLLFLAGVAAWASVFMDEGLARFFSNDRNEAIAEAPADLVPPTRSEDAPSVATASLGFGLSSEDAAVLDALGAPRADPAVDLPELTPEELAANYAVTGIWPKAPTVPQPAPLIGLEDLYVASIDPISSANDAIALPDVRAFVTDRGLGELVAPAAAGTAFALGSNGLVVPTVNGALTPDGVTVFLGRPAAVPPVTPARLAVVEEIDPAIAAQAKLRPQPRPSNLVEQNERSTNGGLTRSELAELRPRIRPALEREVVVAVAPEPVEDTQAQAAEADAAAQAAAASLASIPEPAAVVIEGPPNAQAVVASVRPDGRPRNFARIVRRATAQKPKEETDRGTRVASIAPRTVSPAIPSAASVAQAATVKNAISLRTVNLIGVYGKPSSRRALVRLSNGRYQKVQVGDRIDGGRISAIGDSELRYQKGNRNLTLKMPKS